MIFTVVGAAEATTVRDSLLQVVIKKNDLDSMRRDLYQLVKNCSGDLTCYEKIRSFLIPKGKKTLEYWDLQFGNRFMSMGEIDKGIDFVLRMLNDTKSESEFTAKAMSNLGRMYNKKLLADSALFYLYKSVAILDKLDQSELNWSSYSRIADAYDLIGEHKTVDEYNMKAYEIIQNLESRRSKGHFFVSAISWYQRHPEFDRYDFFMKRYIEFLEAGPPSRAHNGLFHIYKDNDEAIQSLEALIEREGNDLSAGSLGFLLDNLAELYIKTNNLVKAKEVLLIGKQKGIERSQQNQLIDVNEKLVKVYDELGDKKEAYYASLNLQELKDTVFQSDKVRAVIHFKEQYESARKDKELSEQKLLIEKRDTQLTLAGSIITLMIIGGLLMYRWYTGLMKRRQEEQKFKVQELEQENKIISMQSMIEGQELERNKIGEQLQNNLGKKLSTIQQAYLLLELEKISPRERKIFSKANSLLDVALSELTDVTHNLMPQSILRAGLANGVEDIVDGLRRKKMNCTVGCDPGIEDLQKPQKVALYRILQELLQNISKHSQASIVNVSIELEENLVSCNVVDNGIGFDVKSVRSNGRKGLGLDSIQSRVDYLNGDLQYASEKGNGTSVKIEFPIS